MSCLSPRLLPTRARQSSDGGPRARGRATRIRKRTSHITIVVAETTRRTPDGPEDSPIRALRLGIVTDWKSRWYSETSTTRSQVNEDYKIRKYLPAMS